MNDTYTQDYKNYKVYTYPFVLILLYIFIEYGRPQGNFTPLRLIRPGMLLTVLIFLKLLTIRYKINFKDPLSKYYLILIFIMTIHIPIAKNNYFAYELWRSTVIYFIVYLGVINFVDTYHKMVVYIDVWVLINAFIAVIGILHKGLVPGSGFMEDENDFSLVMNIAIPFAYFMLLESDSRVKKFLYFFAVLLFIAGSVVSLSRGGFIGLAVVLFYCWLKTPNKLFSTSVIIVMVAVLILSAPKGYWAELQTISGQNIQSGTGATRWYYWMSGWNMFLANPIIGVGQGNYPWEIETYGGEGYGGRLHGGRPAHSIYFTLLPELGIIGTIIFIIMIIKILKLTKYATTLGKVYRTSTEENKLDQQKLYKLNKLKFIGYGFTGALAGYLVTGIFLSVLYYPHFWILSSLPVVLSYTASEIIAQN